MSELGTPLWNVEAPQLYRVRFSTALSGSDLYRDSVAEKKHSCVQTPRTEEGPNSYFDLCHAVSDTVGGLLWLLSPWGHSTLDISLNYGGCCQTVATRAPF